MSSVNRPRCSPATATDGDVVQHARLHPVRHLDHPAGAADVEVLVLLGVGRHVVQRREVHHVVDLAAQRLELGVGQPEPVAGDVAEEAGRSARRPPSALPAAPAADTEAWRTRTCTFASSRRTSRSSRLRPRNPVPPVTRYVGHSCVSLVGGGGSVLHVSNAGQAGQVRR
jgi:hypothetical protein